jgi:hypothetical protein
MTRIFIEGYELDLTEGLSNQITYAIDDLQNLDSKSTSFTKTIVLPGTGNNNKLLGNIFEFNNANFFDESAQNVLANYNAAIKANARIEVDGLEIMKGTLRLLEIIHSEGGIEYEVAIFGELSGFIGALGNLKLEELDFSGYNHTYNVTNITSSWESSGSRGTNNTTSYGSGYYYPLIDYGADSTNKIDFKLNAFRPSFFVKEYIDKMFELSNYTYDSAFFNSAFFKTLLIPNNQKEFSKKSSTAFLVASSGDSYTNASGGSIPIAFSTTTTLGSFTANGAYNLFTYNSATQLTGSINLTLKGDIIFGTPNGIVSFKILKNGDVIHSQNTTQTTFDLSIIINEVSFNLNDTLQIVWSGPYRESTYFTEVTIDTGTITINSVATYVPFNHDEAISVNDTIPKGIFLKDFFTSIMKMFNLVVYEDKYTSNKLLIEPYYNFFTGEQIDWSNKLDRSKPIKIKPMSELAYRYYKLKYNQDNDFYNENYRKAFNEGYADRIYDTNYDFNKDSQDVSIIFAPSVLYKKPGTDKTYPAIYKKSNNNAVEDRMDSIIRIGMVKKKTGVANWRIQKQDGSGNWSGVLNAYGYFGHLDDPTTPAIDINFGAPLEIYFTNSSYPSNNLFNTYYSGYMAEITDKDSRLITGMFYLNDLDIYNLDFKKFIYLDGGVYKISRIIDYEAGKNTPTKVELLRVIYKSSSMVDTEPNWQTLGVNTCVSCNNYVVYQDTNPYSSSYNNYQVNGVNIGSTPPTFGSCSTSPTWTSQSYNTCSSCGTYLVYRNTNTCSSTYNNYQVNGIDVGAIAPASGDCDIVPNFVSQEYNTCVDCNNYLVYRDTKPCSPTFNNYRVNGVNVGNTAPTNGNCSTTATWTSQEYNTCVDCTNYLVFRDTNPCSATYNDYRVNNINVGSTEPTNGNCVTTATWTSQEYNTCVDCTNYLVYRDTNPCSSTYNKYRVNNVNVGNTAPTNGDCNTTATWTSQEYNTCVDCTNYLVYRDTNACSSTYNNYRVNGVNVGNTAPINGNCSTSARWVRDGEDFCLDCVAYQPQIDNNPCSATYNDTRNLSLGASSPCNYDETWTSQGYNTCVNCINYLVYRNTNPCSATYNDYRVNNINVGVTAPTNGNCSTTATWTSQAYNTCVNCVTYLVYRDTNPCSATYNNYRVNNVNVGNTAPTNGACNTNAVYNSNVGLLYICSNGSVLSYAVNANTNPCFTGNQFFANGNTYASNPSNSYPNTIQNWVANGARYCSGLDLYEPQIQTNECAVNYNGVRDQLIESNSPTCAESYTMSNCLGGGATTYSATYPIGSFSVGERVTSSGVTYVITGTYTPFAGIVITSTGQTGCPEYTQFTDLCTSNSYYILGTGYSSVGTSSDVPDACLQPTGTTSTPSGTQIYNFTSNPSCECV